MKYQYSDSVQITPHFNSAEFRCKCGKEHEFEVNDELVKKLEQLYAALNCSKIIVTTGFRCSAYSGAYGIWQHSEKGKVAGINGNVDLDICYKDFPTIIKGKWLNGWGKTPAPAPDKSEDKQDTTVTATIKIGNDTYKGTLVKE